jgi:hypothetical protein
MVSSFNEKLYQDQTTRNTKYLILPLYIKHLSINEFQLVLFKLE